jgi:hypothetical protein
VGETRAVVESATDESPPQYVQDRYVDQWTRIQPALEEALRSRADEVREQRSRRMDAKRDTEEQRLRGTLADLKASIQNRLEELEKSEEVEQLRLFDNEERRQFDIDVRALHERIERIDADTEAEVAILRSRYAVRDVHWFPVAVEILVPRGEQ